MVKIPSSFLSRVLWAATEDSEESPANTGDKTPPNNLKLPPNNVMRKVRMFLVVVLVVLVSHIADNIY